MDTRRDPGLAPSGLPDIATARKIQEAIEDFVHAKPRRSLFVRPLRGATGTIAVHADRAQPAASLIKVAIAMAVYEAATDGLDLAMPVSRSSLPSSIYPSVLTAFSEEHSFTLQELCKLMLITSDNPIADYLLNLVGPAVVDRHTRGIGCSGTTVAVGFGDDALGRLGRQNTTTARDAMIQITLVVARPEFADLSDAMRNGLRKNRIPLRLPDETPVIQKSGSLQGVANDMGVIQGSRVDLAIAVLCDGEPDTAATSIEIGDMVGAIWRALGEPTQ